jgi:hypothetical protein
MGGGHHQRLADRNLTPGIQPDAPQASPSGAGTRDQHRPRGLPSRKLEPVTGPDQRDRDRLIATAGLPNTYDQLAVFGVTRCGTDRFPG